MERPGDNYPYNFLFIEQMNEKVRGKYLEMPEAANAHINTLQDVLVHAKRTACCKGAWWNLWETSPGPRRFTPCDEIRCKPETSIFFGHRSDHVSTCQHLYWQLFSNCMQEVCVSQLFWVSVPLRCTHLQLTLFMTNLTIFMKSSKISTRHRIAPTNASLTTSFPWNLHRNVDTCKIKRRRVKNSEHVFVEQMRSNTSWTNALQQNVLPKRGRRYNSFPTSPYF